MSVTARWPGIERYGIGDCYCYGDSEGCICPPLEKAIRVIADGHGEPLTASDREVCLREIERVEGYRRADYVEATDRDLAKGVLDAWTDFCRDKGLL